MPAAALTHIYLSIHKKIIPTIIRPSVVQNAEVQNFPNSSLHSKYKIVRTLPKYVRELKFLLMFKYENLVWLITYTWRLTTIANKNKILSPFKFKKSHKYIA